MTHQEICTCRIFDKLQESERISQRSLSRELGVALGLTNTLLRRMIRSGWVEVVRNDGWLRYQVTPAGTAAQAALSRRYFDHAVGYYTEVRARVRASLHALARGWPAIWSAVPGQKRVAFFGARELAEIACLAVKETDLVLVMLVNDEATPPSRQVPPFPVEVQPPGCVNDRLVDCVLILSFATPGRVPASLLATGFPTSRIAWL